MFSLEKGGIMIEFKFNEIKTTQASVLLLQMAGGKMNYMKLIKLLYLIDREALINWGRSLTGDTYFAMKHGPVLSNVLDTINYGKDPTDDSYWYEYITKPSEYIIKLTGHLPGQDKLSKREIELIKEIFNKFNEFNEWDLVEICHEILPEWKDPGETSELIQVDKILEKEKKSPDEIKEIEEEVANLKYVEKILSIND